MAIKAAVTDTGPLIHCAELECSAILHELIARLLTTPQVLDELIPEQRQQYKKLQIIALKGQDRDHAAFLAAEHQLQLAETTAIILAKREAIRLFLTDDLDARLTAKALGLEPHGTLGVLLRSYRDGILRKEEVLKLLDRLKQTSLFITTELIRYAMREVQGYKG